MTLRTYLIRVHAQIMRDREHTGCPGKLFHPGFFLSTQFIERVNARY